MSLTKIVAVSKLIVWSYTKEQMQHSIDPHSLQASVVKVRTQSPSTHLWSYRVQGYETYGVGHTHNYCSRPTCYHSWVCYWNQIQ